MTATNSCATNNPQDHKDDANVAVRFRRKRITSLKLSPENTTLYRPIGEDPDIDDLADSIKKIGLQEPLVITADNYIVSGHRRHAALIRIGRYVVKCRVIPQRRDAMTTAEYVVLLREFNRQRNKTAAEQCREELVDIDPAEAHENLRRIRARSVYAAERNGVDILRIEGNKHRAAISGQKAEHVKFIKKIIFEDRKDYWPLSVRSVHYPLLNYTFLRNIPRRLAYANDDESYSATSNLITRLRLNGTIPWAAIDDFTRPLTEFNPFGNVREFIRQEVKGMFSGYWRDLLQTQPNHIEVVCEKNTIYHMVLRVTTRYQIPTSSGRGFNSIDPWHDLKQRYVRSGKQRLFVIVLSDFDPEGEMIPHVGGRTLRDDFGIADCNIIKAGVTRQQIAEYQLPHQNIAKETSSNYDWFVKRNDGQDTVYELEALDPADMMRDLETQIKSVIDIDLFNKEVAKEQEEAAYLEGARRTARELLVGLAD